MAEAQPAWASDPKVYDEVVSFAEYLGFDTKAHPDLLWIAEQARSAPLPEPWTEHSDEAQQNTYYSNPETQESIWEHPLDEYFKNLYERHKAMKTTGVAGAEAAGGEEAVSDLSGRPVRYQGSASTSRLLAGNKMSESWDDRSSAGKAATVSSLGGQRAAGVDFSLVERLEQERSRSHPEAQVQGRPMQYTGSRSDVVLSSGWTGGSGDGWGAGVAGVTDRVQGMQLSASESSVKTSAGLKKIGNTGNLFIDEGELLGYGSNGTMVFKGRWGEYDVAVKRMHIAFVEMVDAEMKVLLELGPHHLTAALSHCLGGGGWVGGLCACALHAAAAPRADP